MLFADTHTHSIVSPDAKHPITEMIAGAEKNGLDVLCVTDHFEVPEKDRDDYKNIEPKYDESISHRNSNGKPKILVGIEMGGAIYDPDFTRKMLARHEFDFVLNSLHHLFRDGEALDYFYYDYTGCDATQMLKEYLTTLYEQSTLMMFDSLAHLDYPTRYMRLRNAPYDLSKCTDEIDALLKLLVENGKSLEINTSGLFAPFKTTLPEIDIIKRYASFSGEFVTIGSDSHDAQFVGRGFEDGVSRAKEAGINYIAYYEARKPVMIKID